MSEKTEELEGKVAEAGQRAHMWKTLMEHPGWKELLKIMNEQVELRQKSVMLTPIGSVGQCFTQEYYKGEGAGIALSLATPEAQFDLAEQERRTFTKLLEVEDVTDSEVAAASTSRVDGHDDFGGDVERDE